MTCPNCNRTTDGTNYCNWCRITFKTKTMKKGYLVIAGMCIAFIVLMCSCNIGLKSTSCPSHDKNYFSRGNTPGRYKH